MNGIAAAASPPLLEQAEGPADDLFLQLLALFGLQERGHRGHAAPDGACRLTAPSCTPRPRSSAAPLTGYAVAIVCAKSATQFP